MVSQPNNGCAPSTSSRTMTRLSGRECHNLTMKRVGFHPHVATREATTLKWCHPATWEGLDECHDATEENGASSNTPHEVGIEDKLRHKQDRDIE